MNSYFRRRVCVPYGQSYPLRIRYALDPTYEAYLFFDLAFDVLPHVQYQPLPSEWWQFSRGVIMEIMPPLPMQLRFQTYLEFDEEQPEAIEIVTIAGTTRDPITAATVAACAAPLSEEPLVSETDAVPYELIQVATTETAAMRPLSPNFTFESVELGRLSNFDVLECIEDVIDQIRDGTTFDDIFNGA